jgi:hypothetical protein
MVGGDAGMTNDQTGTANKYKMLNAENDLAATSASSILH